MGSFADIYEEQKGEGSFEELNPQADKPQIYKDGKMQRADFWGTTASYWDPKKGAQIELNPDQQDRIDQTLSRIYKILVAAGFTDQQSVDVREKYITASREMLNLNLLQGLVNEELKKGSSGSFLYPPNVTSINSKLAKEGGRTSTKRRRRASRKSSRLRVRRTRRRH